MKFLFLTKIVVTSFFLNFISVVSAEQLTVKLLTPNGNLAQGVGISLTPYQKTTSSTPEPKIMDQINTQFQPYVLMVQTGAKVSFPNSDSVKHHVYSFSKAKPFELKLYRDRKPEPLAFEKSGEVALGCNIHDWMVGYIYVVDTPFFGKTNRDGTAIIKAPEGEYEIKLHSPQLQGKDISFSQSITVSGKREITVSLSNPMTILKDDFEDTDEFDAY